MTNHPTEDFLDAARDVHSGKELRELIGGHLKKNGFDRYAYWNTRVIGETQRKTLSNYDQEWIERYLEARYVDIDPVITRARRSPFPFSWNTDNPIDSRQGAFCEDAWQYGIRSGASFPIHSPDGTISTLTVSADCAESEFQPLVEKHYHYLFLVACYSQIAVAAFPSDLSSEPSTVRLTPREREVLTWSARGKNLWEISRILGVSRRTAKFHAENAANKFGVYSNTEAVVRAYQANLINP